MRLLRGTLMTMIAVCLLVAASEISLAQAPAVSDPAASAPAQAPAASTSNANQVAPTPTAALPPETAVSTFVDRVGADGAHSSTCSREEDLHRPSRHQGTAAIAQRHQYQERQTRRWRLPRFDFSGRCRKQGHDSFRGLCPGCGGPRCARRAREGKVAVGYALYLDDFSQWHGGGDSRSRE